MWTQLTSTCLILLDGNLPLMHLTWCLLLLVNSSVLLAAMQKMTMRMKTQHKWLTVMTLMMKKSLMKTMNFQDHEIVLWVDLAHFVSAWSEASWQHKRLLRLTTCKTASLWSQREAACNHHSAIWLTGGHNRPPCILHLNCSNECFSDVAPLPDMPGARDIQFSKFAVIAGTNCPSWIAHSQSKPKIAIDHMLHTLESCQGAYSSNDAKELRFFVQKPMDCSWWYEDHIRRIKSAAARRFVWFSRWHQAKHQLVAEKPGSWHVWLGCHMVYGSYFLWATKVSKSV